MSKLVCQLDENGYFINQTEADESPLEKGVYLIPRLAIDFPKPDIIEGKRAKFKKNSWVYEDIPQTIDNVDIQQDNNQSNHPMSKLRQLAYQEESDPLFFKFQRGECTKQDWLDKIEEIKNRYQD